MLQPQHATRDPLDQRDEFEEATAGWPVRSDDVDHDVMTCQKPICRQTARMIQLRERGRTQDIDVALRRRPTE